jgi:predicted HAD superfamily Cof-like phosphohydrolase
MSLQALVDQFNTTYKVPTSETAVLPDDATMDRIYSLIHEELMELCDAMDTKDLVGIADALTDILYVTAQQARVIGLPVDSLLAEVQRSNMSKLGSDGEPIFREDGKVLKGPNYSPPDIKGVLGGTLNG